MGNAPIRESANDFLFDFNRNYVSIFYRFREIAGYLSKVTCIWRPRKGRPRSNFAEICGFRKRQSLSYRDCCLCDPKLSLFCGTPTCNRQTDGETDGQMHSLTWLHTRRVHRTGVPVFFRRWACNASLLFLQIISHIRARLLRSIHNIWVQLSRDNRRRHINRCTR